MDEVCCCEGACCNKANRPREEDRSSGEEGCSSGEEGRGSGEEGRSSGKEAGCSGKTGSTGKAGNS